MAKYVIKDNDNNYKFICEDTESRDYWINTYADCNSYEEISDADYVELQKNNKQFTSTEPLNTTLVDITDIDEIEYTQEQLQEKLTNLINRLEKQNSTTQNPPSIWATNLTTLKDINWIKPKPKKQRAKTIIKTHISGSGLGEYTTKYYPESGKFHCTCPGYWRSGGNCKHVKQMRNETL